MNIVYKILILINCLLVLVSSSPIIFWSENVNTNQINETTKSDETILNYRLPNDTIPIQYDIDLKTNIHNGDLQFSGKVIILIKILKNTKSIVIHNRQLNITDYYVSDKKMTYQVKHTYNPTLEFSIFNITQELQKENNVNLTLVYNGNLRTNNGGFYRSSYVNSQNKTIYLAATQFESTDARHGFPCYDEPALKAIFNIKITHGEKYSAISNMPVKSEKPSSESGFKTTIFETTPKMSTYLVAFIVSDFASTSGSLQYPRKFTQRVFSRPDSKGEQKFALSSGLQILSKLSQYLNVSFTLPKMDQVAVPDFAAGAMENWGLVTYREELLLYNEVTSTTSTKTGIATTIAHEYGHQWFGNLVSPKWWTYIWLNEGFASLFAYIGTDMAFPDWNQMEYFIVAEFQRALSYDSMKNPRPMTHYVQKPIEIISVFDSISYSKAACVLRMMQHFLTENIFKNALNKYLNINSFQATEENDLFKQLKIAAKEDSLELPVTIEEFMGSWTRQGGYPLLTVTRNYEKGTFEITQQRYTVQPDKNAIDTTSWFIPFNYATGNKPNFETTTHDGFIMQNDKKTVVKPNNDKTFSKNDWLILNKQSAYYYRINYDENNWKLIIESLKKDHKKIHVYNRAQLLSDAFQLSTTKHLKMDILFDLLTYIKVDDSFAVWSTANTIFSYFNEFLYDNNEYNKFIQSLIKDIYNTLGIKDKPHDQHFDKYTRTVAINWACKSGVMSCLKQTNERLTNFVEKNELIEPNLQSAVYCNGLKEANDKEFDFLYSLFIKSKDQAERQLMMSSLGCAQKEKHLKKFIESSIKEKNLRQQERIIILRSAYSRNHIGYDVVIEFLLKNFDEYSKIPPGFSQTNPLNDDIIGLAKYTVNKEQKTKMSKLLKAVENRPELDKNLSKMVEEKIQSNLNWLSENEKQITDWINKYNKNANGIANHMKAFNSVLLMFTFTIIVLIF